MYYTKIILLILIIYFKNYLSHQFFIKIKKYYEKRIKFLSKAIKKKRNYNESDILTFEDKINWLIIHDTNRLKGKCADKIFLHEYSKKKLGKDICNKILKIYNSETEIDIKELPNQFVFKTNHGSSFNIIVEDKTKFNFTKAKKLLKRWMKEDFGAKNAEFHYSFIKRKIFAEEYLGKSLKNYKFLCYNGRPKYIYLSIEESGQKYRNFYDMNWIFINFTCLSEPHPKYHYPKPKFFELMKEYAKIFSKDFKFVRVDFYELENEVRLGELTFTPMNSFFLCNNIGQEIELGKEIIIRN